MRALAGSQGDIEEVGHLVVRQAVEVEHGQRHAVLRRQGVDCPQHHLGQLSLLRHFRRPGLEVGDLEAVEIHLPVEALEQRGPVRPQPVHGDAERHPPQPGRESRRVLELVEVEIRADKRLLCDVLRLRPVLDQAVREAIHMPLVARDQGPVGLGVALACQSDQILVGRVCHRGLLALGFSPTVTEKTHKPPQRLHATGTGAHSRTLDPDVIRRCRAPLPPLGSKIGTCPLCPARCGKRAPNLSLCGLRVPPDIPLANYQYYIEFIRQVAAR